MKFIKALLMAVLLSATVMTACSSKTNTSSQDNVSSSEQPKTIVCYFSATGTTAEAARRLADLAEADIYEIRPEKAYTEADLNWRDSLSRSSVEMHNRTVRPAIAIDSLPDFRQYDIVMIGYPNWWNSHPSVINTFIESSDLTGKTVAPFMTSGGSGIENSEKELKESYPTINFSKGLLMNSVTDDQIRTWIEATASK